MEHAFYVYARINGNWFFERPQKAASKDDALAIMRKVARDIRTDAVVVKERLPNGVMKPVAERINHA